MLGCVCPLSVTISFCSLSWILMTWMSTLMKLSPCNPEALFFSVPPIFLFSVLLFGNFILVYLQGNWLFPLSIPFHYEAHTANFSLQILHFSVHLVLILTSKLKNIYLSIYFKCVYLITTVIYNYLIFPNICIISGLTQVNWSFPSKMGHIFLVLSSNS